MHAKNTCFTVILVMVQSLEKSEQYTVNISIWRAENCGRKAWEKVARVLESP